MLFDSGTVSAIKAATTEFDWFLSSLDASFCIPDNTDLVIFGFNGVGKSTLVKLLKKAGSPSCFFFDYDPEGGQNDLLSNISKRNEVQIKVDISQIVQFQESLRKEKDTLDQTVKNGLNSKIGITSAKTASRYPQAIKDAQAKKTFRPLTSPVQSITNINTLIGNVPVSVFVECENEMQQVGAIASQMQILHNEHLYVALAELDKDLSPSDSICPVCGNPAANIKVKIQALMAQLGGTRNVLSVEIEKKYGIQLTSNQITDLVTASTLLTTNQTLKEDYFICGGDISAYSTINANLANIKNYQAQIASLSAQALAAYNAVFSQQQRFEDDMENYFQASHPVWDSTSYSITFQLPRQFSTYSTGEKNLLVFLYHIYEFLGSDKTTLVLDDPASSLDLVNQYKMAYEIVRTSVNGKHLVVLSHSPTLLNTLNGQHSGHFAFYYIEDYQNKRYMQQIPLSNLRGRDTCLMSLKEISTTLDSDGLIADLRVRDQPTNALDPKLFHYDTANHFGSSRNYSNDSLISEIDAFTALPYDVDFFKNTYNKIRKTIALRLWVEKELYCLIKQGDPKQTAFLNAWTLGEQIDQIFNRNGTPKSGVMVPPTLTRDRLMSKKVMLNECIHYDSQVMPFAYSANLSLDDVNGEILEIKRLFGK